MEQKKKNLYIIAGCNGAGKTTASFTVLPEMLNCKEFVNADEMAKGLSPFNPEGVALQAGRLMIERVLQLMRDQETFAFETTLSPRSYVKLVKMAQKQGYYVSLLFFSLATPEQAVKRVAKRVSQGGHNIPTDVVYRRYASGLKNLFQLYIDTVDFWALYDNSDCPTRKIAYGWKGAETTILDEETFNRLKKEYDTDEDNGKASDKNR